MIGRNAVEVAVASDAFLQSEIYVLILLCKFYARFA